MKKIAILSFYSGKYTRGVETWVRGLEVNLQDKFEIRILTHKDIDKNIDWNQAVDKNSFLRKLYFDYWSLEILKFNLRILNRLVIFKPDIILATDGGWEPRIMRLFSWITGAKLVIAGQAGIGWDEYNNIYSFPDCFIALSEKAKLWAKKHNPFIKVIKIPNAVDLDAFKPSKYKTNSKVKTILSVGALEKGKRMDKIIKAIANLNTVKLTIIGEGPEKQSLINLAKSLNVNLEIKKVDHKDISKEFAKANLFVSASESYYSFEIVLIEAMATNLPIVANKDEIRKEIIENAGVLTDPENLENFSKDIKKALDANWESKPRQQAMKFSWKSVSKKYEDLFNKL